MLKLRSRSTATSSMFTRLWMSMHTKPLALTSEIAPVTPMGRKLSASSAARGCSCRWVSTVTRSPSAGALPVSSR